MTVYRPGDTPVPGYTLDRLLRDGPAGELWRAASDRGPVLLRAGRTGGAWGRREERLAQQFLELRHKYLLSPQALYLRDVLGRWLTGDPTTWLGPPADLFYVTDPAEQSLADLLAERHLAGRGGLPPGELLDYLADAAEALDFLARPHYLLGDRPLALPPLAVRPADLWLVERHVRVGSDGPGGLFAPPEPRPDLDAAGRALAPSGHDDLGAILGLLPVQGSDPYLAPEARLS